ncbi:MAG: HAMP domain-containing sensor histidine kinase [Candidatus Eisenbacteria bacterium]|nr:HAMP domain-containing sensor histidine kinase [Candidatus Eisenbacteria bacterium]
MAAPRVEERTPVRRSFRSGWKRPLPTATLLRGYLVVGSLVLASFALFYTNRVVNRLNAQTRALSAVMARVIALSSAQVHEYPDSALISLYRDLIGPISFPIVITDENGRPRVWRGSPALDAIVIPEKELSDADPRNPGPALKNLLQRVTEFDRQLRPEPLISPRDGRILGYLHYGHTGIVGEIRWVPWLLFGAAALFATVGIVWFRSLRRSEQNRIWAGMAKETAHQLGTPISSLMGWLELAGDQARARPDGVTEIPTALFQDVEREIASDLERLRKVANRFGHIGSLPVLTPQDIVPIVASTVGYYRRRLPQAGLGLALVESFDPDVPFINVNAELMGWVVENLVKNAIDATDARTGRIEVSVRRRPESETVEISVRDNGKGIPPADQRRVFEPGFTTKKRGWGLGLTLVRRIVEDYHGGRIELRSSLPEKGSEFVISFPV